MGPTLALMALLALAPGQGGALQLTNARLTQGLLGAPRADSKFYPGDTLFLSFDLDNVQVASGGKVLYSMGMEVTNGKGRAEFRQSPQDLEAFVPLGGRQLPASAHVDIGVDMPPGEYTLKVSVTDRAAKSTQAVTQKFEVLPRAFAVVRLQTTVFGEVPVPPLGVVGQDLIANFAVVAYERDAGTKQPHVTVEMQILDENGKLTTDQPLAGELKDGVPAEVLRVPMQFLIKLTRPGKFTVKIKATDQVAKKTAEASFALTVLGSVK